MPYSQRPQWGFGPTSNFAGEPLSEDRVILGDRPSCIAQISRFHKTLGLTHLICRFAAQAYRATPFAPRRNLFAREVMPAIA